MAGAANGIARASRWAIARAALGIVTAPCYGQLIIEPILAQREFRMRDPKLVDYVLQVASEASYSAP